MNIEYNYMSGLTENTNSVFEDISNLSCIKSLYLCGGTGISIQLQHRLSEDLDFELIGTRKDRPSLDFGTIMTEVLNKFPGTTRNILSNDHFEMRLPNEVKLSFFRPANSVPSITPGFSHNNLVAPSLQEMLGMKIFTISVRNTFRDYYDIYCLLKAGCSIEQGIQYACDFSRHTIHTKYLVSSLLASNLFVRNDEFDNLKPIYDIHSEEIATFIEEKLQSSPIEKLRVKIR